MSCISSLCRMYTPSPLKPFLSLSLSSFFIATKRFGKACCFLFSDGSPLLHEWNECPGRWSKQCDVILSERERKMEKIGRGATHCQSGHAYADERKETQWQKYGARGMGNTHMCLFISMASQ